MRAMTVLIILAVAVVPGGMGVRGFVAEMRRKADEEERRVAERQKAQLEMIARRHQEEWVSQACTRLSECRDLGAQEEVWRRDKVFVWDNTAATPLPAVVDTSLKPGPGDEKLTVFLITNKENTEVATYGNGVNPFGKIGDLNRGITGYRVDLTVSVVNVPERVAIGSYVVPGSDPPPSVRRRNFDFSPEYGDWEKPLAAWIRAAKVRPTE